MSEKRKKVANLSLCISFRFSLVQKQIRKWSWWRQDSNWNRLSGRQASTLTTNGQQIWDGRVRPAINRNNIPPHWLTWMNDSYCNPLQSHESASVKHWHNPSEQLVPWGRSRSIGDPSEQLKPARGKMPIHAYLHLHTYIYIPTRTYLYVQHGLSSFENLPQLIR